MRERFITVPGRFGPLRLRAVVTGQLAATLTPESGRWTITHVASGRRMPVHFPARRYAVACSLALDTDINWGAVASATEMGVDPPPDVLRLLLAAARDHRGSVPSYVREMAGGLAGGEGDLP
jgi:hypothetical protein